MEVLSNMLGVSTDWLRWGDMEIGVSPSASRYELNYQFINPLPAENMEIAVVQDYRLLSPKNKRLISSIIEILLTQQNLYP